MAERDWEYIGDEDTDDSHISRFKDRRTGKIEEVVLTPEEAKYLTLGDVVDRLLRQVGESRWQDEFASMLSKMLNR